jgi:hypothetical protein
MLLNDKIPDCGVAACGHAIQLWTGQPPTDADVQIANDRFSSADYDSKVLAGWRDRGIGPNKLGSYARIRIAQIPDAIARYGCAILFLNTFRGVTGHAVLAIPGSVVSWGQEYPSSDATDICEAYAVSPKWQWILLWWSIRNAFI